MHINVQFIVLSGLGISWPVSSEAPKKLLAVTGAAIMLQQTVPRTDGLPVGKPATAILLEPSLAAQYSAVRECLSW